MEKIYDIIVIGGGHAGIEASFVASKMGCRVLLLTLSYDDIGKLSCNPAVGGVAKGTLVREVDSLGGLIGRIADRASLGYRILNRSKGKAVWATRAQVDMFDYPSVARKFLEDSPGLEILQAKADKIIVKGKKIKGVETNFGHLFKCRNIVVCAGTFLKSIIHIGLNSFRGGRLYEESSDELFESIKSLGFKVKHFKTGTCARLDKNTIDFSAMIEQAPEGDVEPFSFKNKDISSVAASCFVTHTNKKTHKIILDNLKYSPLYSGKIRATGVRYCPSLEDKIVKFKDKEKHQIFMEPEGADSLEVYPNGVSTSLPFDVQIKFLRSIKGLENAEIRRPGYGIEHGLIDPRQLYPTLESKSVEGLYFAGQVNGTTGYEEAAAQGLVAGINAALRMRKKRPFVLSRNNSYTGVLIDDLTSKGVDEPYRMFTSRSEFRLSMRETNAVFRLAEPAYELRLISKKDLELIREKEDKIKKTIKGLFAKKISFAGKKRTLAEILKMPGTSCSDIEKFIDSRGIPPDSLKEIEIRIKYEGFINREKVWLKELKNLDRIKIPEIDYASVPSLSREVVEKLSRLQPATLGSALKISGITPAAIMIIYNYIKKKR
ncbi:MAG: tRNA uridine-5-carboxymethylaminomethyl(34) synthesis enzyme MnmG [Candidatus Omnitrophica bacterium]|nr:tRNA uridine-5-carboxymethylaminomethyl(34) synthesis enzyme MnmG [Candidatus Omnitrophota bacterium]MBD3268642.1 tRNA uridine-5-carboxymethylaminomethyl(34) synthesis enzyme MnmG [Candidatus Omnitrophota bacterium]